MDSSKNNAIPEDQQPEKSSFNSDEHEEPGFVAEKETEDVQFIEIRVSQVRNQLESPSLKRSSLNLNLRSPIKTTSSKEPQPLPPGKFTHQNGYSESEKSVWYTEDFLVGHYQLLECPFCGLEDSDLAKLHEHVNHAHLDAIEDQDSDEILVLDNGNIQASTSRSSDTLVVDTWKATETSPLLEVEGEYICPFCMQKYDDYTLLEVHIDGQHSETFTPTKTPTSDSNKNQETCPVCFSSGFGGDELALHVEQHFSEEVSPITPGATADRLLAKEIQKCEQAAQQMREKREFEFLRARYGMDEQGNFASQSDSAMLQAVYSGSMTVSDYHERRIMIKVAEKNGMDDGFSVSKDIIPFVARVSSHTSTILRTLLCHNMDHYASTFGDAGWGCGYRNLQMLVSALLRNNPYVPHLVDLCPWVEGTNCASVNVPSINCLQIGIEKAWGQGFDVAGSEQLAHKLRDTRKWIGATEITALLSSLGFRVKLVDFHCPSADDGSHPALFEWVGQYFDSDLPIKPPLYLQHQGHSRSIIGVEHYKDKTSKLLIMDPSHSCSQMHKLLQSVSPAAGLRLLRRSPAMLKHKQYQIVAVMGLMQSETEFQASKTVRSQRIP